MTNGIFELIAILILFNETFAKFKQRRITTLGLFDLFIQIIPDVRMEPKFDCNWIWITKTAGRKMQRAIYFEFEKTRIQHLELGLIIQWKYLKHAEETVNSIVTKEVVNMTFDLLSVKIF